MIRKWLLKLEIAKLKERVQRIDARLHRLEDKENKGKVIE